MTTSHCWLLVKPCPIDREMVISVVSFPVYHALDQGSLQLINNFRLPNLMEVGQQITQRGSDSAQKHFCIVWRRLLNKAESWVPVRTLHWMHAKSHHLSLLFGDIIPLCPWQACFPYLKNKQGVNFCQFMNLVSPWCFYSIHPLAPLCWSGISNFERGLSWAALSQ